LLKRADTKPEDRERRDKLGLFQCTTLGLWNEGLATLAGCEDSDLRAAVEAELAFPETPEESYSVGGLWWNLAEGWKGTPDERAAMRARACYWYRLAQAGFDATTTEGLLIESRLAEASALDQPPPPATPTSAPKARTAKGVSQKATVYRGEWSIENAAIVGVDPDTESSDPSCMAFGDPSWSEFDLTFQMQVSRVKQDHPGGAGVRFHYQSKKDLYQVALGPRHPRVIRWLKGAWKDWAKVKPKIGYDGWNTVHLEVRGTEARCLVDGQQVAQFGDMELTNGQLGFQAQDVKLVIKDIQVTDPAGNVLWAGLPKFEK